MAVALDAVAGHEKDLGTGRLAHALRGGDVDRDDRTSAPRRNRAVVQCAGEVVVSPRVGPRGHRSSAPRRQWPLSAAVLFEQAHGRDLDAAVDGLAHVVDRERGDRGGDERLHLDPGAPDQAHLGRQVQAGQRLVGLDLDARERQRERVAERDELVGALGGHDAGEAGRGHDVALRDGSVADDGERRRRHDHARLGARDALGLGLAGDVDHARPTAIVQM